MPVSSTKGLGQERGFAVTALIPIAVAILGALIIIALAVAIAAALKGQGGSDPCADGGTNSADTQTNSDNISTAGIDSLPKRNQPLKAVLSTGRVTVQPSIVRIINLTKNLQTVRGFETIGDRPKLTEKYPQHSRGYAVDIMATKNKSREHTILANWLQVNSGALDIAYMIWDRKFWNGNSEGRAVKPWANWRPYTVPLRTGVQNPTQWHEDHIHITVNGYKPNTPHTSGNLTNVTSQVANSDCSKTSSFGTFTPSSPASTTTGPGLSRTPQGFPRFSQCQGPWRSQTLSGNTVCGAGCGPSAFSAAVLYLMESGRVQPNSRYISRFGKNINPGIIATLATENGVASSTTRRGIPKKIGEMYFNLQVTEHASWSAATDALKNNIPVILGTNNRYFTSLSHFIVLFGIDVSKGVIYLADSGGRNRTEAPIQTVHDQSGATTISILRPK